MILKVNTRRYSVKIWISILILFEAVFIFIFPNNVLSAPEKIRPVKSDWTWLYESRIPLRQVTLVLNNVWAQAPGEAEKIALFLVEFKKEISGQGAQTVTMIAGIAFERAGKSESALQIYQSTLQADSKNAYAYTADIRQRILKVKEKKVAVFEKIFEELLEKPAINGWFMISGMWNFISSKEAALNELIRLRSDRISFRFFQYMRSYSLFSTRHSCLFILMVLTIGIKTIQFPIYIKAIQVSHKIIPLRPEIKRIQDSYGRNSSTTHRKIDELYRANGITAGTFLNSGCSVILVDIIFIIWVLSALNLFSPQLILDNAGFRWISDITQYDFRIIVVWFLFYTFQAFAQQRHTYSNGSGSIIFSNFVFCAVFAAISWYWDWPSYIFIFWIFLIIVGFIIRLIIDRFWPLMVFLFGIKS